MSREPVTRTQKSFWRLLVEFAGSLAMLAGPVLVAALLPLDWGLIAEAVLMAAVPLLVWRKAPRWAQWVTEWASWAMVGLGWSLWRTFPTWWGAVAGVVLALAGTDAMRTMERHFKLTYPRGGKQGMGRPDSFYAHSQTPEGEPIRVLNEGETGHMNGPITRHVLFADGVLLSGVGTTGRFSRDGRYFAAVVPHPRDYDGLLVLDRMDKTVRFGDDSEHFWQLPEFTQEAGGIPFRLRTNRPSPWWDAFLRQHAPEPLQAFQDLWLIPSNWFNVPEEWHTTHTYLSPDHRHTAVIKPIWPDAFAAFDDPIERLVYPRYEILLDDTRAQLVTLRPKSGAWRDDSLVFACRATLPATLDDAEPIDEAWRQFWCWSADGGWQPVADNKRFASNDVSLETANAAFFEGDDLRLDMLLDTPVLDHGRYGTYVTPRRETLEVPAGTEADGVFRPRRLRRRRVSLAVSLPCAGPPAPDASQRVISSSPDGLTEAVFTRDHDSAAGLSAWRCRIGDWHVPGLWLLDHRWMEEGDGLALCRFTEALPMADQVALALPERRQLLRGPAMLVEGLHDAYQGEVAAIELAGRIDPHGAGRGQDGGYGTEGSPLGTLLAPFDVAAPTPETATGSLAAPKAMTEFPAAPEAAGGLLAAREAAVGFLAAPKDRYFYRIRRFRAADGALSAQPAWRIVHEPQACCAEGDFVYPAQGNGVLNAAWYFGGHVQYGGGWPAREEPRGGGFLLTAHGHAVADLSPAMIWSQDGTLLALCRPDDSARLRWRLLLLDQRHGLLHADAELLPRGVPRFLSFDHTGLSMQLEPPSWDDHAGGPVPHARAMAELYALPTVAMIDGNAMRLEATQAANRHWWEALDTTPLAPYRSPR